MRRPSKKKAQSLSRRILMEGSLSHTTEYNFPPDVTLVAY